VAQYTAVRVRTRCLSCRDNWRSPVAATDEDGLVSAHPTHTASGT